MDGFSKRDFESKSRNIIKIILIFIFLGASIFFLIKIDVVKQFKKLEEKISIKEEKLNETKEKEPESKEKNDTNKQSTISKNNTPTNTNKTTSTANKNNTVKNKETPKKEESKKENQIINCSKTEEVEEGLIAKANIMAKFENNKLIFSKHDETIQANDEETLLTYYLVLKEIAEEFNKNMLGGSYTKVVLENNKISFIQTIDYKTLNEEFIKNQEYIELEFTSNNTKEEFLTKSKEEGYHCN